METLRVTIVVLIAAMLLSLAVVADAANPGKVRPTVRTFSNQAVYTNGKIIVPFGSTWFIEANGTTTTDSAGRGYGTWFAATDIYDPVGNTWATKATLPVGRGWSAAAGAGGKVYVFGGSGSAMLGDCWMLDPVANTWTQKANMPGARAYHVAVSYQDTVVYVLGGNAVGGSTVPADNLVYKYHIPSNAWSTDTPMITPRGWQMANVVGNSIWVAYGSNCITPTYLVNLEEGVIPMTGMEEYRLVSENGSGLRVASPVRERAQVRFSTARKARVSVGIYDVTGSLVRTLVDDLFEPGHHLFNWDRTAGNGRRVAGGTYFCRLTVDGRSVSAKSIVLD